MRRPLPPIGCEAVASGCMQVEDDEVNEMWRTGIASAAAQHSAKQEGTSPTASRPAGWRTVGRLNPFVKGLASARVVPAAAEEMTAEEMFDRAEQRIASKPRLQRRKTTAFGRVVNVTRGPIPPICTRKTKSVGSVANLLRAAGPQYESAAGSSNSDHEGGEDGDGAKGETHSAALPGCPSAIRSAETQEDVASVAQTVDTVHSALDRLTNKRRHPAKLPPSDSGGHAATRQAVLEGVRLLLQVQQDNVKQLLDAQQREHTQHMALLRTLHEQESAALRDQLDQIMQNLSAITPVVSNECDARAPSTDA